MESLDNLPFILSIPCFFLILYFLIIYEVTVINKRKVYFEKIKKHKWLLMVPLCFSTLAYQMTSFNRAYLFPLDFNFF